MTFQADYYDGISARAKAVTVRVLASSMSFEVEGETRTFNLADIDVQAKLGATKRLIDLPDGGRLEALDISELEAAMPSKASKFWSVLHYLENHLGWVMASVVMTVFAGWLFLQFGVPKLAEYVAKATPPSMEAKLGEQVLDGLDTKFGAFSASKLSATRKADIAKALTQLCTAIKDCPHYRLEFRDAGEIDDGGIGPNAFALPGGIMVVTDQIVRLSHNDTELVAVIAHELGHVKGRHAFRQSIQGVLSGLILASITGDVSSVGSGLPAVLMQMRYTRELETEADEYALNAMQKACLPPQAFADILQRLESQMRNPDLPAVKDKSASTDKPAKDKTTKAKPKHESAGAMPEILSSHPDTQARIKPFLTAKPNCTPPAKI
jgi:Zn-dependent protease with chaperone function